ncbi:MAG: hypothetical protein HKN62_09275 [Phycisphaerales bacterium]|nr:hypothetical protein [Phycisphaerales bacterium]
MNTMRILGLLAVCTAASTMLTSVASAQAQDPVSEQVPEIPATPVAVTELVYARPFTLERPETYWYRVERPQYGEGVLLVVKVDPSIATGLLVARQRPMPIAYVGDQVAQVVNHGDVSGTVILMVPTPLDRLDLTKQAIWFGTPDIAERVDARMIAGERQRATDAGIKPFARAAVDAALAIGGPRVDAPDVMGLLRGEVLDLLKRYAPTQTLRIESLERQ